MTAEPTKGNAEGPQNIGIHGLPGTDEPGSDRSHRLGWLRRTLTAGVTVIAPLWFTGWVLWTLFGLAERFSRPLIRPFLTTPDDPQWYYQGIGFLLTIAILLVVGTITTHVLTRRLLHEARSALERLPVVRTIYTPVRKLMETMTSSDKAGFQQVVLFEYPRKGTWTLGFLAGDVPFEEGHAKAHSIFVPTAPNPTTGFMLIVPKAEITPTRLTVEEAFQMIVSAGVAVPVALRLPASVHGPGQVVDSEVVSRAVQGVGESDS